jgi:di/tricarboxylate transporter
MTSVSPALLSDARTVAAYAIFIGSYVVFALGKFPRMKIDRPGAAIIGGVLMVAFRIVGAPEALASIDFATIVLLFSMMLLVANLRVAGFFDWIAEWLIERLHPHHLMPTVIFTTGLLSAFLVNDIVCLVMTPFVVHMTRRLGVPPIPYVVAVATASNIGSVATITGNPQNMLIGSLAGIPYVEFIAHLGPVALVGLCLNWAVLHRICLRGAVDKVEVAAALSAPEFQRPALRKKPVVVLTLVLVGFLAGTPPALVAAVGAALLLIHANSGTAQGVRRGRLGASRLLHRPVRHRRRSRTRWADRHAAAPDRVMEPSPHSHFRLGDGSAVQRREQRTCGDAAAHCGIGFSGSARWMARTRDVVHPCRKSDHHRVGGEHHRRGARRRGGRPRRF